MVGTLPPQLGAYLHLVLSSDQAGHVLNADFETPMNNTPGHVCQPTSRADTLRVLYSALSVTVSTFSIEQFTITRVHEYGPLPAQYKSASPEGTSFPSSPDHIQV